MAKKNGSSSTKVPTAQKSITADQAYDKAYSTAGKTTAKKTAEKSLTATQAYDKAYSTAGKTAGKTIAKTAGKTIAKSLLKRLPYVGGAYAAYELADASYNAYKNSKTNKKDDVKVKTPNKSKGGLSKYAPRPTLTDRIESFKPASKSDGLADYMKTVEGDDFTKKTKSKPASKPASKPKTPRPTIIDSPKRTLSGSVVGDKASVDFKTPTTKKGPKPNIGKGPEKRTYSDTEKKILGVMDKGKKADGTMRESAKSRIKNIQSKAKRVSARSERKEGRATKRTAVKTAKANLRAARKS